jgi:hypothetical protein
LLAVSMMATPVALGNGPDVILADLYQTRHWGASGGIEAYSVGTISCNEGTEPLQWQSWSSKRPVIAQNIFRIKDGRFEQLGHSWCKWAFASLNQDFCGDCIDPGSGSLLGVNCSDPYSASLNGSQSTLGPKSIINPWTGEFPADHPSPGSGTIAGRIQVVSEEIDPDLNPDALYLISGQYISPDDASAGNQMDNASWRQVWVESDFDLSFNNPEGGSSETVRKEPAISAWPVFDDAVQLTTFDVPDDGRFYLAWKAVPLEDGVWHYEIAIHNLNSERALRSVTIPAATEGVENVGFRDVHYHSGEPFDGTDWEVTISGAGLTWATVSFDVDPDANALRWGTTYNFWFDAAVNPVAMSNTVVGLFKPGLPEQLTVGLPDLGFGLVGDLNCDGVVNGFDIDPFVIALSDPSGYAAQFPDCDRLLADVNGDGAVDGFDIDPFVLLLTE